jgi:hypothetical protein
MDDFHLAQINIARLIAPIDDPLIASFVSELDAINALAEASPGFVWRLKSAEGNATDVPYNDDPFVIANMSVWTSVEALKNYTYNSRHLEIFKQRRSWFEKGDKPNYCLWWIPAGHIPPWPKVASAWNTISNTAPPHTLSGSPNSIQRPFSHLLEIAFSRYVFRKTMEAYKCGFSLDAFSYIVKRVAIKSGS